MPTHDASRGSILDFAVIGGGIVGLATARAIATTHPGSSVAVFEKEAEWASHQTGRNSGVIHSGIYYQPGTLKAGLCSRGNRSMFAFCAEHGIAHQRTGKLVVATRPSQLGALDRLHRRGTENGVPGHRLTPSQARAREPNVSCCGALFVETTGTCDFRAVGETLARLLRDGDVSTSLGTEIAAISFTGSAYVLESEREVVRARHLVNCAGLFSDRVARLAGVDPGCLIVPFRGEFYELAPPASELVNGLVYPVPDPRFPFLGVHVTRGVDGSVHVGPNAVVATKREGYRWRDFDRRDLAETLGYAGFWRLARRHLRAGVDEVVRSTSRRRFAAAVAELVPGIRPGDLVPSPAGVRAQAVDPTGALLDDFRIVRGPRALHVVNAPSPAATSAFEIADWIVGRITSPDRA